LSQSAHRLSGILSRILPGLLPSTPDSLQTHSVYLLSISAYPCLSLPSSRPCPHRLFPPKDTLPIPKQEILNFGDSTKK